MGVLAHSVSMPHALQVWGIVAFIFIQVFHNLQADKRIQLHTFFFLYSTKTYPT